MMEGADLDALVLLAFLVASVLPYPVAFLPYLDVPYPGGAYLLNDLESSYPVPCGQEAFHGPRVLGI